MLTRKSIKFVVFGLLLLAAILVWSVILLKSQAGLEVTFFDVGQGNAVLIKDAGGNKILIDGGPDNKVLTKLAKKTPYLDRKIDLLILTHPDVDHLNGALELLKNYQVAGVLEPCIQDELAAYQEWQKVIQEKKIERICAHFGQSVKLSNEVVFNVLSPFFNIQGKTFNDTNDASIIAWLDYGQSCFLLTGDAPQKIEKILIKAGLKLKCDILQVAHHGSKTSTSQEFLEAVKPETAVISVAKDNRYGHPHEEVLERLQGVKVYRTDQDGDIEFKCTRDKCLVRSEK